MRSLTDIREDMRYNNSIDNVINQQIKAHENSIRELNSKKIDIPLVELNKIGVCDWFKSKYPNTEMTDEQIIDKFEKLEEKYGDMI